VRWKRLLDQVLLGVVFRIETPIAAALIAASALFLTLAWEFGLSHAPQYRHFTQRADARIVESWLALEIDVASIRVPANWRASAIASPCAVVEYAGDWGSPARRAFCGNRFPFNDAYTLYDLRQMAPDVPFAWARDERGFIVPEIRVDAAAYAWLESHEAHRFMHDQWPAKSALEWLRLELDRPVEAAVAGWTVQPSVIPVAFDPQRPTGALPAASVKARATRPANWLVLVIGSFAGLALWFKGMDLLPLLSGWNALGRRFVSVALLATVPWWVDYFPQALQRIDADIAGVLRGMMADIDRTDRMVSASEPMQATLAMGTRLTWRLDGSAYSDTLGRLRFVPPPTPFRSANDALTALTTTVTTQVGEMNEDARAALFANLERDKRRDLRAAGIVFLPAATQTLSPEVAAPNVTRAARRFLEAWTTQPVETPDPHDADYDARIALQRVVERSLTTGGANAPH
jgi:hypothetical protein